MGGPFRVDNLRELLSEGARPVEYPQLLIGDRVAVITARQLRRHS